MTTELCAFPDSFTAGTTVSYRRQFGDYPASAGWSMKIHLTGPEAIHVDAVPDGDSFVVTLAASVTDDLGAGTYTWTERVTGPGGVFDVGSGYTIVAADPAAITTASLSWEERAVVIIKAKLEGRLTADRESFQIYGRSVNRIPMQELVTLLSQLEARIRQRRAGRSGRTILVSFPSVGDER